MKYTERNLQEIKNKKKKIDRLERLVKEYKRGLLLDEDVIEIIKVVFKKWKIKTICII